MKSFHQTVEYKAPKLKVIEIKTRRVLCQSPSEAEVAPYSTEMTNEEW